MSDKSENRIEIHFPSGHLGASTDDDALNLIIRALSLKHGQPGEWADKYGTNYEDEIIAIHRYCWCEGDSCPWCASDAPNFLHKPSGFTVRWYKYIGREMNVNMQPPRGLVDLVTDADIVALSEKTEETRSGFAEMLKGPK
jgi:hypothetical protein